MLRNLLMYVLTCLERTPFFIEESSMSSSPPPTSGLTPILGSRNAASSFPLSFKVPRRIFMAFCRPPSACDYNGLVVLPTYGSFRRPYFGASARRIGGYEGGRPWRGHASSRRSQRWISR